eukprot:1159411-Pelagomonas_calceolata.AAC.8
MGLRKAGISCFRLKRGRSAGDFKADLPDLPSGATNQFRQIGMGPQTVPSAKGQRTEECAMLINTKGSRQTLHPFKGMPSHPESVMSMWMMTKVLSQRQQA